MTDGEKGYVVYNKWGDVSILEVGILKETEKTWLIDDCTKSVFGRREWLPSRLAKNARGFRLFHELADAIADANMKLMDSQRELEARAEEVAEAISELEELRIEESE